MSNTISSFTDLKWKLFRVMKHYIRSLFHLLPFCNRMPSVLMLTKAFLPSRILASDKIFFVLCLYFFYFILRFFFQKNTKRKVYKNFFQPHMERAYFLPFLPFYFSLFNDIFSTCTEGKRTR